MLLKNNSECSMKEINNDKVKSTNLKNCIEYDDNNSKSVDEGSHDSNAEADDESGIYFTQSKNDYGTDFTFKIEIVWKNVIAFAILHILALYGVFLLFTQANWATVIYVCVLTHITGLALNSGSHRLWAHKAYKARFPFKLCVLMLQTVAGQNSLWEWVRDHRQHHRYSDTDGDPHNPRRGFFFSHVGWLMCKKHPLVKQLGKTIDMSDLEADPWVMFQKRHYNTLYFLFAFLFPVLIPVVLWKEDFWLSVFVCFFTRYVYVLNAIWSLNSIAHNNYGSKNYDKNIIPVDNKLLALLTLGDGCHNFHHVFPWDYRAGEWRGIWNISTTFINLMHYIGQAYDLKIASPDLIKKRMQRTGDGTIYEHIHLKTISKQL